MRAWFSLAGGALTVALAACAASDDREAPPPGPDGAPAVIGDGGAGDVATSQDDASADPPRCSPAGWCVTELPDADLLMRDVWPLSSRAFAVAESQTLGVKVLEWSDAAARWMYIDDGTQNESGFGRYAGKIWAPNEDEIYYTVSPGYVYRGVRPTPPATAWTWTRQKLASAPSADPDDGNPSYWKRDLAGRIASLGVWGTSATDVYAWFKNTLFHRTGDGDAEWVAEYATPAADAAEEQLYFFGAAATADGDVWFSGGRARVYAGCALLVRKTGAGYRTIADGSIPGSFRPCTARAGAELIGGTEGWLTDIQTTGDHELVALKGARDVVRISSAGDDVSFEIAPISDTVTSKGLNSIWSTEGMLWASGAGVVVRGDGVWDGGAFQVSTISLSGGPLNRPFYQVRGSSNTNLWAMGVRYALHKTTP